VPATHLDAAGYAFCYIIMKLASADGYLIVQEQFWSLEVPRCNPDVVFLARMIKLGQTPVYEP